MSPLTHTAELWTLRNGNDAVRCVAAPHPLGVELQYIINEHPLMSHVVIDWTDVAGVSDSWRERLESRGWVEAINQHMARRTGTRH